MQLHHLTRPSTLKRPYRRVGRGQSSTRGKQSGRGGKGQTARAGAKMRPELRDLIKKLPKRRGYGKNRGRTHVPHAKPLPVSLAHIASVFDDGASITTQTLIERRVIRNTERPVKIVSGDGKIEKKLSIKGVAISGVARASVEKAGGSVA